MAHWMVAISTPSLAAFSNVNLSLNDSLPPTKVLYHFTTLYLVLQPLSHFTTSYHGSLLDDVIPTTIVICIALLLLCETDDSRFGIIYKLLTCRLFATRLNGSLPVHLVFCLIVICVITCQVLSAARAVK